MRLIVIGGDAAGMTAAAHVLRAGGIEVAVAERGPYTSYSMCGIPYFVGGMFDAPDDLVVRTPEEFREQGMTVWMRTEAIAVDPEARTVRLRERSTGAERDEPYDALLLATGAQPSIPGVAGMETYARPLRTLEHGEIVRRELDGGPPVEAAVVIGAGYIGLEMAEALVARGVSTTLVDAAPDVMKTLDHDMAAVVEEALGDFGVAVRLSETIVAVEGADRRPSAVVTETARYPADLVVLAAGTRPNTDLAVAAGCDIGPSGGVVVDSRMRTTVEGVWAAGDVVESTDLVAGLRRNVQLGTHANKQGKVAGVDIVAAARGGRGEAEFPGLVGTAVTRVCKLEIGRCGLTEAEAQDAGIAYAATRFTGTAKSGYMPEPGEVHVKMLAERGSGRVLGCQLVGTGNVAKRIDVAAVWCQLGVSVSEAQLFDLSYAPPFGGVWDLLQIAARKLTKELDLSPQL